MTTPRWRGTLIYVGSLAAMGAAGLTKFAVLTPPATVAGSSTDGTSSSVPASDDDAAAATDTGQAGSATDPSTSTDTGSTTSDTVTIVGSSVQTRYGPVQVSVTITAGQITDVQALQVPGGHHESVQINARATPILAQEVVDAQSAQIDTVSGATYTSEAYAESVQSAIDQQG
ncbi:FMN-binding protein [Cellulomonas sp.]|uniref:FMN-binding protein n=1 Tax=Cellulomonas sp. TaxID=40001 RepID=UPI003BA962EC